MPSQTVFRLTSQNGFEGLKAFQEPVPTIAKTEILVKIRSVSLNYREVAIATNTYPIPVKDNLIPCSDMAGEVIQVGELVRKFSVGDTVISPIHPSFLYGRYKNSDETFGGAIDGFLREYVALPAHVLIKTPTPAKSPEDFAQWASLVATGSTVWNAFYGNQALKPGDTVLVQGTGGVSLTALIFAKAAGSTAIVTSSSDEKLEYVKTKYGADHTINYKTTPNWATEVLRITNGAGVDHIMEVGGTSTVAQSLECVAPGGVISVVGYLSPIAEDKMPNISMLTLVKAVVFRGVMGGSKEQLEEAVRFVGNRGLTMPVDRSFSFTREGIIAALEYVAKGKHIGKVCISLD